MKKYKQGTMAIIQYILYRYVNEVYPVTENKLAKVLLSEGIHIEVTGKSINITLVV